MAMRHTVGLRRINDTLEHLEALKAMDERDEDGKFKESSTSKWRWRLEKAKLATISALVYLEVGGETAKLADKDPGLGIPLLLAETALTGYGAYKLYKA